MKTDIRNRQDIQKLIDQFYMTVKVDPVIGDFFTKIAHVDWDKHLPQMYDFWESILFSKNVFSGNPMKKHKELNQKSPLNMAHFDHWIIIFNTTVDSLFVGKNADRIKDSAAIIKENLAARVIQDEK